MRDWVAFTGIWFLSSCLLLREVVSRAEENNENAVIKKRLADHYYKIREGIGAHKSPSLYGAFPTDPYSHTPGTYGSSTARNEWSG